jgi:hypothetical protein
MLKLQTHSKIFAQTVTQHPASEFHRLGTAIFRYYTTLKFIYGVFNHQKPRTKVTGRSPSLKE